MTSIFKRTLSLMLTLTMALALSGCASGELEEENLALKQELSALMEENAALKTEISALEQQLAQWNQEAGLADFRAEYSPWEAGDGATVTVTAVPAAYQEGQQADLSIWLDGQEWEKMPFQWDGAAYTATVELAAADGYTFLCLLTGADGKTLEIVLDSPEMAALMYLESNLTAFLNIMVNDWTATGDSLRIHSGYAQVQLPQLVEASIADARLVLTLDGGEQSAAQSLTFTPGADEGSFENLLEGIAFPLPQMAEDSQLELTMEVTLSDGRTLTITGGSWYYTEGELLLAVG